MRQPYNSVVRVPSDQGGSVESRVPHFQEGIAVSTIHTAHTFIPCDIKHPAHVHITPILEGRSTDDIVNGVALFTTVVGWYIKALLNESLEAATAVDDWVASQAYLVGTVTLDPDDAEAYVCIVDHSASATNSQAGFLADVALGYWQKLPATTKFIQIIHTSAGSGNYAQFTYRIEGYL